MESTANYNTLFHFFVRQPICIYIYLAVKLVAVVIGGHAAAVGETRTELTLVHVAVCMDHLAVSSRLGWKKTNSYQ